jgi:Flp pilus assembly CpaE family ATPase
VTPPAESAADGPGGARPVDVTARLATLERAPVFFTLGDAEIRALARRAVPRSVAAGTVIQRQGDRGAALYVVHAGRCEVSAEKRPGHSVVVAFRGPGDSFAEAAVFGDQPVEATVRATEDAVVLVLDRQALLEALPDDSEALMRVQELAHQRRAGLTRLLDKAESLTIDRNASIVSIYSPKGGSGRTTLAVNLAAHLGRRFGGEVLLLDLSLPFNHAALMSKLIPTGSLAGAAQATPEGFEEALLSSVLHHPEGMTLLPGVLRAEEADLINPDLINRALAVLRGTFRYIVVDLGVTMSENVLTVLEQSDPVILLATPEISTLKDIQDVLRIFENILGIAPSRMVLVMNNTTPRPVVTRPDVERTLKQPVHCEIPFDGSKPDEAAVRGQILVLHDPRSAFARGASTLSGYLTGQATPGDDRRDRKVSFFKVG